MSDLQFTEDDGPRSQHRSLTDEERQEVLGAIKGAEAFVGGVRTRTWAGCIANAMKEIVLDRLDKAILSAAEDTRKEAQGVLDLLDAEESDAT